ncbi:GntR family transcriptional regulator [Streptomyces sp. GbtcB7]|uniref:GntR family transcriptional regulator n=1 Tax=Streptomyces sp. GbtcB7 TaxID=2824752 RepID=UPI001C310F84|nr:GntR family transcriptional regulator [Streptomyces sp. GbtcB7]
MADSNEPDDNDVLSPDVPMQLQIYRQLRADILDGLWVGRNDFPGERELAERFGVSAITSCGALERLHDERLVDRGRGRRTKASHVPSPDGTEGGLPLFHPEEQDTEYGYRLLRAGMAVVPAEAARFFELPPGSELWECARPRVYKDQPHVVMHNVQRPETGTLHKLEALQTRPMMSIVTSEGLGVATVRRRIRATNPPPQSLPSSGPGSGYACAHDRPHSAPRRRDADRMGQNLRPPRTSPDSGTTGTTPENGGRGVRPRSAPTASESNRQSAEVHHAFSESHGASG